MQSTPADWPPAGEIDLEIHDLPHDSSGTEWWYQNCHFTTVDGRQFALFAAFFRIAKTRDPAGNVTEHAHAVTWALTDLTNQTYIPECGVDSDAPKIGLEQIRAGGGPKDGFLTRAMKEVLERGQVPQPDRRMHPEIVVARDRLRLEYDGASFHKSTDGRYHLTVKHSQQAVSAKLTFAPEKRPVRHGDDGRVRGTEGEDMFYYFIPRCAVSGEVTLNGETIPLKHGSGWYDHEFGAHLSERKTEDAAIAWNWCALQLEDGTDVTVYALSKSESGENCGRFAIVVDRAGRRSAHDAFELEPLDAWRSTRTFNDYPTRWQLTIPGAGLRAELTACFADQEFITVISKPAFWEGRVDVKATLEGRPVKGVGYVERSGFSDAETLDDFFTRVGAEVRKSVRALYPDAPSAQHAQLLIASSERASYMQGVELTQLSRTLLAPVRELTDRGGKGWRSYAALVCCDVVKGDSRKFAEWLAIPELIHVGSLVVDDVEDRSTVRRGGPCAHLIHGEAIAINAGTAAYFMCERLLRRSLVADDKKLVLYDLYFEAMRAGHAGQAIDLEGFGPIMPGILENGDGPLLEERVLAVHRLKTAAPAAALARMGAVVGGGTPLQIEAVGGFFEALGLAFQIIDDVLNLRGFAGELKQVGEDISHGKATLPIAKAITRLNKRERYALWASVAEKPTDPAIVAGIVAQLEACGAVDACVEQARTLIEDAWRALDPIVEDSYAKIMLRAFGWFVLERHY